MQEENTHNSKKINKLNQKILKLGLKERDYIHKSNILLYEVYMEKIDSFWIRMDTVVREELSILITMEEKGVDLNDDARNLYEITEKLKPSENKLDNYNRICDNGRKGNDLLATALEGYYNYELSVINKTNMDKKDQDISEADINCKNEKHFQTKAFDDYELIDTINLHGEVQVASGVKDVNEYEFVSYIDYGDLTSDSTEMNEVIQKDHSVQADIEDRSRVETENSVPGEYEVTQIIYSHTSDTLYFVQIAADRVTLSDKKLMERYQGHEKIKESYEEGWYKYLIGGFDTYDEAKKLLLEVAIPDAFIVSYYQGKRKSFFSSMLKLNRNR